MVAHLQVLAGLPDEALDDIDVELDRIKEPVLDWQDTALELFTGEEGKDSPDQRRLEFLATRADLLERLETAWRTET